MVRTLKFLLIFVIGLAIVGVVVVRGINSRIKASEAVRQETNELAIPSVAVTHPKRGSMKDEVVLPGNVQAFTDAPIYARTSGYLKKWYFDIGARVKTGQLLADIEAPEIEKQLEQARADVATAEANLKISELTANRYEALLKMDAISKQDTDTALSTLESRKTMLTSARANVKRLEDMVSYLKVYAPFDGVITARNVDIGALINAGNGGVAQELFHLAATDKLRVFVSVPQAYSRAATPGVTADLSLTEYPGRRFVGKIARTSNVIDQNTRTLLTEIDIDNAAGQLMPGAYAQVHLKLPTQTAALIIPVPALIFRAEGLKVAVVRDNKAELVSITVGRDYGSEIEVTSGITEKDNVVINPPDSLLNGSPVRIETPAPSDR